MRSPTSTTQPARWHRHGLTIFTSELLAGLVTRCLPRPAPTSPNALSPATEVRSVGQGLLCGARKFTHLAYLGRDPEMLALLGIKRVPSRSTFARFCQCFIRVDKNLAYFRALSLWAMDALPGGPEG